MSALGAIAAGVASDPGTARIEAVQGIIRVGGASCVFSEPEFDQSFAETVIESTDVRAAVIDRLGSAIAPGPQLYPALLCSVASALATCVQ